MFHHQQIITINQRKIHKTAQRQHYIQINQPTKQTNTHIHYQQEHPGYFNMLHTVIQCNSNLVDATNKPYYYY